MIRDAIDREVEAVDSGGSWCLCASLLHSEKLILVLIKCFSAQSSFYHHRHLSFSPVLPFPVSLRLSIRVPAG